MKMTTTHLNVSEPSAVIEDTEVGEDCTIWSFVHLVRCKLGNEVSIGAGAELMEVTVGDRARIGPQCFIPKGVTIEEDVFIGPKVCFTNDKTPSAERGRTGKWTPLKTTVKKGANIGAHCTILPGVTIGEGAMIGAGSVIAEDVGPGETWIGPKARKLK